MGEVKEKFTHGEPIKLCDSVFRFHQPKGPAQLEVVFVHGLVDDNWEDAYWKTWLARDGTPNNVWPMTWLPADFPFAQVYALKYDASIKQTATDGRMDSFLVGENLVQEMVDFGGIGQNGVPVVFVCHGFGDLVAKQIVVSAKNLFSRDRKAQNLLRNILGFIFYSTPHRGSVLAKYLHNAKRGGKGPLLENMEVLNTETSRLSEAVEKAEHPSWYFASADETHATPEVSNYVFALVSSCLRMSSRNNLSSLFSSGTLPKGWSEKELEVYEKITSVPPDKPRPLVVIMDLGEHHHDLAVLVILKELHRLGFISLQAVVATTKFQNPFDYEPAYHEQARACSARARLARAALNSLDLSHVPVAQGRLRSCASGRDGSTDLALRDGERGPEHDELCMDQLLDRQLEICGIVEYIESDSTMVQHLHHGSGQDLRLQVQYKSGQDLLRKVYGDAKEKGEKLHVLCLPSLQDIHEFSTTFTNAVAEWTAEVYVGTVSNTQLKRQKLDSSLQLFHFNDGEMSEEWHSFLSKHRIPSNCYSILTRSSSQMAWKKTLNDLVSIGHHPIIAYLFRTAARYSTRVDNMLTDVLAAIGAAGPHLQAATGVSKLQDDHCYPKIEDSIEEKLELAMSALLKGFLLDATSETLCDFCGSVNFGAVGYNKPQKSAGVKLNDNERTNRPIRDILQNVKCIFCRVVAKSFHDWSRGKFDMQAFDLQNDSNEACYEMVRLHGKDKDSSDNMLTRIKVALKVFTYERVAYCVTLEFQACSKPLQDSAYNPQPEEAYHGRVRPLYADIGLFKRWIRDCCNNPGPHHHCGKGTYKDKTGEFMGLDGLRLIDVERMCVVDVQNDVSYTALSYVWGEYKSEGHRKIMPKLTTENRVFFQQAGTLRTVMLPRTIADAIDLTKSLGFAYIWIDCLCIVQGDEMDERYFIPQMDVIFGCAVVTIVAAAGDSANAGLPGINKPRTREQVTFDVKKISLVQTLDPQQSGVKKSSFNGYLKESQWCKRGWTFQEKLLSPRALIFTEEQVYWECQTSSWCEDGFWEKPPGKIYRHCFGDYDYCLPWQDGFEGKYRKMVEEYTGRNFKFEKDRRDAFEGILQGFQWHAKRRHLFLWALPKRFLSNALTWYCKEISPQRREEKCRVTSEWGQPIKDCPFPSWSWLGWAGKVCFSGTLDASTVDLSFYYFFGGKLLSAKQTDATVRLSSMLVRKDGDETYGLDQNETVRKDGDETIVTLEDIPKSLDRVLVQEADQSNILLFWSSTAILHVRHDGVESDGSAKLLVRNNVANSSAELGDIHIVSWLQKPSFPEGHAELVEFVVIGLNSRKDSSPPPCVPSSSKFLAVILVESKNGVAYRQGLVHVELSEWLALKRKWKLIFLG